MAGKKHQLAQLATALGLTRLLEKVPRRPSLLILNYHRIGDPATTPFDSGVFSCKAHDLERHILYLHRRFRIVGLPEAIDLLDGRTPLRRPTVLLSFDDGYLDNYQLAFPLLARYGVPAAFFLPTAFVGTGVIPWWDAIASLIKRSPKTSIELTLPSRRTFRLTPPHREHTIRDVLNIYKSASALDADRLLAELETACDVSLPSTHESPARNFLNWNEAREMQAAGMHFGSHSHTHSILSKLPLTNQIEELRLSREILERELGRPVDTFAYPVGDRSSFNADTLRALSETGYRYALSFVSGVNRPGSVERYNVLRAGIFAGSLSLFRLRSSVKTLFPTFTLDRHPRETSPLPPRS